MKRFLLTLLVLVGCAGLGAQAQTMGYYEARDQAWFLTDKMAYELNLTPEQRDRAFEINLDYLMSLRSPNDCYGNYWSYRDTDLRCVLFDWQYTLYASLDYFFRPIRWVRSAWYYPVCDHYRTGFFYFMRPQVYVSYHGVGWHKRRPSDRSRYYGIALRRGGGMRDSYHHSTSVRPPYRPEYGRPGHNAGTRPNRPSRPGHSGQIGSGARPDHNTGRPGHNTGRPDYNRPGSDRPSAGKPSTGRPGQGSGGNSGGTGRPSYDRPGAGSIGSGARPDDKPGRYQGTHEGNLGGNRYTPGGGSGRTPRDPATIVRRQGTGSTTSRTAPSRPSTGRIGSTPSQRGGTSTPRTQRSVSATMRTQRM